MERKLNFKEIQRKLQAVIGERPKDSFETLTQSTLVREPGDHGDIASAFSQEHAAAVTIDNYQQKLARARAALDRIKDGTYGTCLACDKPIALRRLKAVPWTPFCVGCQEKLDRRELVGFEHLVSARRPMRNNFAVR